ncbi:MAG: PAS domain S-box protein, partial [Rhodospirillales bacterium]|nr:PAS domain S-box protein [Rhodospirillales bacterium]
MNEVYSDILRDASTEALFVCEEGRIVQANLSAERIFEYAGGELSDMAFRRLISPEWHDAVFKNYEVGETVNLETVAIKGSGEKFPITVSIKTVRKDLKTLRLFAVQDISERWRIDETNWVERKKNAALLEMIGDGVVTISAKGIIRSFNKAAEDQFGWNKYQVIGKNTSILIPDGGSFSHESHLSKYAITRKKKTTWHNRELIGKRQDGTTFPFELTLSEVDDLGEVNFIGVIRDIEERKNTEQVLKNAADVAQAADMAKTEFLANMSHELRTPLNAIIGFSQLINMEISGPVGNENYKQFIKDIHSMGEHLLGLIEGVMDISRVESGKFELDEQPTDISVLASEAVRVVKARFPEQRHDINSRFCGNLPRLKCDAKVVKQILLNLVTNAVKFSP